MSIFISIACYMDPDVINTINNCLENADHPEKIVFGICYQHDPKDDCLKGYENNKQFKIIKMHWKDAKGPAYARALIYDLFTDEDYYLQIDCHSRFYKQWDTKIIHCFQECKKINEKIIISYYPINILNMHNEQHQKAIANISTIRSVDKNTGIKTHGRFIDIKNAPKTSWGISAAMLFFDKEAYAEVPFDKEIYYGLQFEEQVVLAARYWTHGYDIFTPNQHILATEYLTNVKRQKEKLIINSNLKKETYNRLLHVMKLQYDKKYIHYNPKYIGSQRSLLDYYKMFGNHYTEIKNIFTNNFID